MTEALKVSQLSVNYDKVPVLWDVNFSVPAGKVVGLVGPNGAGKTTLLKTMLGLIEPIDGEVLFLGKTYAAAQRQIAYVPQRGSVDWDFPVSVFDVVMMGRYGRRGLFGRLRRADAQAARRYLKMVGMERYADRQISQLSGGQQQRVFLARALMQEAEIYLFDEPLTGIDAATEKVVIGLMHKLRDEGKTLFVVHHDLNTVSDYFDWVVMLNMRLVAAGPVSDVFNEETIERTYGRNNLLFGKAL